MEDSSIDVSFRVLDPRIGHFLRQVPRIGDDPLECRRRSRFRGTEIDLVVLRSRSARENSAEWCAGSPVPVPGACPMPMHPRHPGFMNARPGREQRS